MIIRIAPRHRPLQVHDAAVRAASVPQGGSRIPLQVPHARRRSAPLLGRNPGGDPAPRPSPFTEGELDYLRGLRFIKNDYVEFLSLFHLKEKYVEVKPSDDYPCGIDIHIAGPWLHTILFEIPVLAIVNEVYFRRMYPDLHRKKRVSAGSTPRSG